MKSIDLRGQRVDLEELIALARKEPVLLLTADGKQFLLAEADDFDREGEALRGSQTFQRFLDERSQSRRRVALEEIEAEIDKELAEKRRPA